MVTVLTLYMCEYLFYNLYILVVGDNATNFRLHALSGILAEYEVRKYVTFDDKWLVNALKKMALVCKLNILGT